MELVVHNISGKATSKKVILDDSIFGIEPNNHAIYLDTKLYMANQRQGTHDSRERSDVTGSSRKIKRQKGTGTARAGDIKNPLFRGGGRVFGPHPHDYYFKLNKKVRRLARKSALSFKAKENDLMVIEDFKVETPKTKEFITILNSLEVSGKKALFVLTEGDANAVLSSRNLQGVKLVQAKDINTYEILNANKILLVESSLKAIEELFSNK
jgi:large subunit ribosomal protein L4